MEKITFQCETITPMFLAGADGKTPELRPPSIKAAMRFWWRVMNGHLSLAELKKKESEIFGGSGDNEGRSKFSIRVKHNLVSSNKSISGTFIAKNPSWYTFSKSLNKPIKVNPIEYLGYGAYNFKDKWSNYLPPNSNFTLELGVNDKKIEGQIIKVFKFLESFGALGAKSRNGYGQFRILDDNYLSFSELKSPDKSSNYSHLSNQVRVFKLKESQQSWEKILEKLGSIYRFSKLETDGKKHEYGNRKFIAAPVRKDVFLRKTKPYFFNVWKIDEKYYEGFVIYMPFFSFIQDKEIYTNKFDSSFSIQLQNACDLMNNKLLENGELIEVQL